MGIGVTTVLVTSSLFHKRVTVLVLLWVLVVVIGVQKQGVLFQCGEPHGPLSA